MSYGVGIRRKDRLFGYLLNYLNEISLLRGLGLRFWFSGEKASVVFQLQDVVCVLHLR